MTERRSQCPISFALDIFGDKWTLLIVRDMALHGRHHYGEFAAASEHISTNILADRLELLVEHDIVQKSPDPTNRSRRIYTLTKKGLDLLPILIDLIVWSAKHDPDSVVPRKYLRKALHHREELLAHLREQAERPASG